MTTDEEIQAVGDDVEFDRSVIGKVQEVGSLTITRDQIARYCEVIGETNPLYTDDEAAQSGPYGSIIAPAGMLQTMPLGSPPDAGVKFGTATFAAGRRMEFFTPIRVGDTITARAQVKEVYQKTGRTGRMVFVVSRWDYLNQRGEEVAAIEQSFVHREIKAQ